MRRFCLGSLVLLCTLGVNSSIAADPFYPITIYMRANNNDELSRFVMGTIMGDETDTQEATLKRWRSNYRITLQECDEKVGCANEKARVTACNFGVQGIPFATGVGPREYGHLFEITNASFELKGPLKPYVSVIFESKLGQSHSNSIATRTLGTTDQTGPYSNQLELKRNEKGMLMLAIGEP